MALTLKSAKDTETVLDSDLVADGSKDTAYTYRHLTIAKHREITAKHTKKVPNKRTHQMEDQTNWEAHSDDLFDSVLVSWTGVRFDGKDVGVNDLVTDDGQQVQAKWLLDGTRRTALLERAGLNEVMAAQERRSESFRPPAGDR